ncbi:MAG TPA: AtpZ/AtpI family protein [Candidatus Limnocylindrales bacterium]|nr:AtpZ/AtpI family protein [Candidatus Limnocylindrales bacterium]
MNEPGKTGAYVAVFSQVGLTLAIPMLIGAFGGSELDKMLGTRPLLVIGGLFGGMVIGGIGCYRLVTRFLERTNDD